jgi:hypothetical protein
LDQFAGLRSPPAKQLFQRMEQHQLAALHTLATTGFLDTDALHNKLVSHLGKKPPKRLQDEVNAFLTENSDLFDIIGKMANWPLSGPDGLKKRSALEEFKYDQI